MFKLSISSLKFSLLLFPCLLLGNVGLLHAAAIPIFDVDELRGAKGVNVVGTLYDAEFIDGSCIEIFNGCDEASDFTFWEDQVAASAAAQALLDQVFVGIYDDTPGLTFGCSGENNHCNAFIPYFFGNGDTVGITNARNWVIGAADIVTEGGQLRSFDQSVTGQSVYAKFTVSAVPLPAALPLFVSSLIAMFMFCRRQKSQQSNEVP